jgi:hypothetical protein
VATRVIAFDVNETLLDLSALDPLLEELFDDAALRALSNSPQDVEQAQLAHAGLTDRFDAILSADTVRALKPRREPYELAARTFGVPTGDVLLVAAHAWDIAGASAAGCRTAFVAGPACPAIRSTRTLTSSAPTSPRSQTASSRRENFGCLRRSPGNSDGGADVPGPATALRGARPVRGSSSSGSPVSAALVSRSGRHEARSRTPSRRPGGPVVRSCCNRQSLTQGARSESDAGAVHHARRRMLRVRDGAHQD